MKHYKQKDDGILKNAGELSDILSYLEKLMDFLHINIIHMSR